MLVLEVLTVDDMQICLLACDTGSFGRCLLTCLKNLLPFSTLKME